MTKATATCGHEDTLGYLTGLPCGDCAREGHRQATKGA